MSNWFVITSAINVSSNEINNERFLQTIGTIDSIRHYCENTKIVLLDAGRVGLSYSQQIKLENKCDVVIQSQDNPIKILIEDLAKGNIQYLKSTGELLILSEFMKNQKILTQSDRVFKISGRYFLTPDFDLNAHNKVGKFVFVNRKPSVTYYNPETMENLPKISDWQYMTRMYSFCGSLIPFMTEAYENMLVRLVDIYFNRKEFTDIEHLMYTTLDEKRVIQLDKIGVAGLLSDNGEYISE